MTDNITDISKVKETKMKDEIKKQFAEQLNLIQNQQNKIDKGQLRNAIMSLLGTAKKDHGGSRRCAMFLLSLWNGDTFKADLQDLLYNDYNIFKDMIIILEGLAYTNAQLDTYLTKTQIQPIIEIWGDAFRHHNKC